MFRIYHAVIIVLFLGLCSGHGFCQKPFDGNEYANSWINTAQTYVRISVTTKGLQSVSFNELQSAGISILQPEKFQLYHRGKKVDIISISNNTLTFYGEPNDGGSDSLLYRPRSSRANPYTSLFSDKGAYFLTIGSTTSATAEMWNEPLSGVPELYHLQTDVVRFVEEYSQSTLRFIPPLFQSYFENQEGWTSVPIRRDGHYVYAVELKNRYSDLSINPVLEVLMNGRQNSINHNISISIGADSANTTSLATMTFLGISGKKTAVSFPNSLLTSSGRGYLKIKSNVRDSLERNSVTYYSITYPQQFIMPATGSYYFNLTKATSSGWSRVKINNAGNNSRVFDVTDIDNPKEIAANWKDGALEVMVKRTSGKEAKLLVSTSANAVEKVVGATMTAINPENYDYYIISNTTLLETIKSKYKPYRESSAGGGHRVLALSIQNIYDQFNYGEVSPVGIRRFVDFMLSKGSLSDKSLLLVGTSITVPENLIRDLPNEVPTVGFPGSDALLVEGLAGVSVNSLAIPVGRIPAKSVLELTDYLEKVKTYESGEGDNSWKKNVMHMSGGKSTSELSQLKNALAALVPVAESGYAGAKVQTVTKKTTESVEAVNISSEVNSGLGMITYFGHGSPSVTDLDMGYITAPERGYQNTNKYSFMYFNGCGVGNIFTGSANATLATDWLMAGGKGAIAVIANSYFSYYSPTNKYLRQLYNEMFVNEASSQLTVGQIMVKVSAKIATENPNIYDVANIHQSLFMGDPALHIIQPGKPDYSFNSPRGLFLKHVIQGNKIGQGDSLLVGVIAINGGRYDKNEKVDIQIDSFYDEAEGNTKVFKIPSIAYRDTLYFTIAGKNSLSGVRVRIDPENLIEETDEDNNDATLAVNWATAKEQLIYWGEDIIDVIAPRINVLFDNRKIRNKEVVRPNPVISIGIEDDNLLVGDTTLVDVLIKPCFTDGFCNFNRISYDNKQLQMNPMSGKGLEVLYTPGQLESGEYELFINARDLSGNPVDQPYRMNFIISGEDRGLKVINSPNPATGGYVRFETQAYLGSSELKHIEYSIYNIVGVMIEKRIVGNVHQGNNEWYWYPNVPTGVYLYKVTIKREDDSEESATGKINLIR